MAWRHDHLWRDPFDRRTGTARGLRKGEGPEGARSSPQGWNGRDHPNRNPSHRCGAFPGSFPGSWRPCRSRVGNAPWPRTRRFLEQEGVRVLVSLTEEPPDREVLASRWIDQDHIPVQDFTPPSLEQYDRVRCGGPGLRGRQASRSAFTARRALDGRARCRRYSWSPKALPGDEAIARVRRLRPRLDRNAGSRGCRAAFRAASCLHALNREALGPVQGEQSPSREWPPAPLPPKLTSATEHAPSGILDALRNPLIVPGLMCPPRQRSLG